MLHRACPSHASPSLLNPLAWGLVVGLLAAAGDSKAAELDTRRWPLAVEPACTQVQWPHWKAAADTGVPEDFRPIVLTHCGDGSGRIWVAEQRGTVYLLSGPEHRGPAEVFLDIRDKVSYHEKTNEEGLLGLALHPQFAANGQFFVYYTNRHMPHQNVVARYRIGHDKPRQADPASEEILLVLNKPFWNHDGGTLVFGPDGMLYIAVGDGGAANDPLGNGQKLNTLLGKILRIDVDRQADGLPYAVAQDNPFAGRADARGEIWAYGLRNVWRMAFDRATGTLWAADVGQDLWEEIDLIERGGNYGWNHREGKHPFTKRKPGPEAESIEPIWEYHHDVGKSITGGLVYRGSAIPELQGAYLYADYVSGKVWALEYDPATRQVTANRELPLPKSLPVLSFGEDESGEAYCLIAALDGQGIFRIRPAAGQAAEP